MSMALTPKMPTLFEAACKDCGWFECRHDRTAAEQAARSHSLETDHLVRLSGTDAAGRLYLLRQIASFERAIRDLPPTVAAAARARRRKEEERAERRRAARKKRAAGTPSVRIIGYLVRPATKREAAMMVYHHKVCSVLVWAKKPLTGGRDCPPGGY